MSQELSRPAALVTGGAKRVGKIFSLECFRLGYTVYVHYFKSAFDAENTAAEIINAGGTAIPIQADLTKPEDIFRMFSRLETEGINLQLLVNCAAEMTPISLPDVARDAFDAQIALNLRAPLHCTQAAARLMHDGVVVNISDLFAPQTWKKYPVYGLSKYALEHLTQMLAESYQQQLRVYALALGPVLPIEGMSEAEWSRLLARSAMEIPVSQAQIRQVVEKMLRNEYSSGETILVDTDIHLRPR